jgi:hypothetical protein
VLRFYSSEGRQEKWAAWELIKGKCEKANVKQVQDWCVGKGAPEKSFRPYCIAIIQGLFTFSGKDVV